MQTNKVLWYEGMFLQPHHFQQQDLYLENLMEKKGRALSNHFFGFLELILDLDLLKLGKLGIKQAKGIFPDGTLFSIPENDPRPEPLDIVEFMNETIVHLALPIKEHAAITGEATKHKLLRYHSKTYELVDGNADNNETAEIELGGVASKILTDQDELSSYCYLSITKVMEVRANHQIILDKNFIAPCLDVHAFHSLSQVIIEFHGLLNHRAEMLAGRLTDTQDAGTAEMVDFILLQLINRYEPIFHYLSHVRPLHPEKLFMILSQLMGEMATFTNDKRRPSEIPIYKHEQPYETFQPLIKSLRHALSMVLEQNAISIVLQERGHGVWVGQIPDMKLVESANFILAVFAEVPADELRKSFPLQIKIAPVEQIRILVSRALPGINLEHMAVAPRQIPYHANFSYFSINTSHELWKQLQCSAGIAFHVGKVFPGLKLECWAIKG